MSFIFLIKRAQAPGTVLTEWAHSDTGYHVFITDEVEYYAVAPIDLLPQVCAGTATVDINEGCAQIVGPNGLLLELKAIERPAMGVECARKEFLGLGRVLQHIHRKLQGVLDSMPNPDELSGDDAARLLDGVSEAASAASAVHYELRELKQALRR